MAGAGDKKSRVLEIFYRAFRGESISVKKIANEYQVSTKSISRDISEIKNFLSDNRDLVGNAEFEYSYKDKSYHLKFDDFLLSKELNGILKVLIGSRAFSQEELLDVVSKLKKFVTYQDRTMMENLIRKEIYHYKEVGRDCDSVIDHLWTLTNCIYNNKELTINYYKMNRTEVVHRIRPLAISFSENYFYLFAADCEQDRRVPIYFRVDRIKSMTIHRDHMLEHFQTNFDEGQLRQKIQYMFPGHERKIKFEFSGPSVQAILDRLPTAKIIDKKNGAYLIEATVYGEGIKMYLLSQGSWVKVIEPLEFVESMKEEIEKLRKNYED